MLRSPTRSCSCANPFDKPLHLFLSGICQHLSYHSFSLSPCPCTRWILQRVKAHEVINHRKGNTQGFKQKYLVFIVLYKLRLIEVPLLFSQLFFAEIVSVVFEPIAISGKDINNLLQGIKLRTAKSTWFPQILGAQPIFAILTCLSDKGMRWI